MAEQLVIDGSFGRFRVSLGGPLPVSPLDAVHVFERVGGRAFEVSHVPEQALMAQLEAATDPMQRSFTALMCSYAKGDAIDMTEILAEFPVTLTSVERYAERVFGKVPALAH